MLASRKLGHFTSLCRILCLRAVGMLSAGSRTFFGNYLLQWIKDISKSIILEFLGEQPTPNPRPSTLNPTSLKSTVRPGGPADFCLVTRHGKRTTGASVPHSSLHHMVGSLYMNPNTTILVVGTCKNALRILGETGG